MRYQLNSRRVSLGEFRLGAPPVAAEFVWLISRLPIKLPGSTDILPVESLADCRIEKDAVKENDLVRFRPLAEKLKSLGFKGTVYHQLNDSRHQAYHASASYLHESGKVVARIRYRECKANKKKHLVVEYLSLRSDGGLIVTSGGKRDLNSPEEVDDHFEGDATPDHLWRLHRERIKPALTEEKIATLKSAKQLLLALEQHHMLCRDDLVQRGVYQPVADLEVIDGESFSGEDDAVLAAVRKKESNTQNWWSSLLILLVSMAAFFGVGVVAWSWKTTVMIVGVLFFHELGHYIAMRAFDYRNVKMFFIPFLGAAVSGRNHKVAGWKRVVVSLMGPVPGIMVGLVVGVFGFAQSNDLALSIAGMLMLLNGFNLLPCLPLDGGWVMHALLFVRHPYLDIAFRVLAALGLLLLSAVLGGRILMFIGISMLISIQHVYKTIKISEKLRGNPELDEIDEESRVPTAAVRLIASEIDDTVKSGLNVSGKAGMVVQIYDLINTRPPGLGATLLLGAIYAGSFFVSVVAGFIFLMAQQADLRQLMVNAVQGPQAVIKTEEILSSPANLQPSDLVAPQTVVASYLDRESADMAFELAQSEADGDPVVIVGNQVLIPLEEKLRRGRWIDLLEPDADVVGVSDEDGMVSFRLHCIAPSAKVAEEIQAAMDAMAVLEPYDADPLMVPWDTEQQLSDEHKKARLTFALAQQSRFAGDNFGEGLEDVYDKINAAEKRGNDAEVKRLHEQLSERQRKQQMAGLQKLRDERGEELDLELLSDFEEWVAVQLDAEPEVYDESATKMKTPDVLVSMAKRMGQSSDASPLIGIGYVSANGLILTANYITFPSPAAGSIAMIRWLESEGCLDFKGDFQVY